MRWPLVLALVVAIPVGSGAAAGPPPAGEDPLNAPAAWLEGVLRSPWPARASAELRVNGTWLVHWVPLEGAPPFAADRLRASGAAVGATYYERPWGAPALADAALEPALGRTERFASFDLRLDGSPSPQELLVTGASDRPVSLGSSSDWRLSTHPPNRWARAPLPPSLVAESEVTTDRWNALVEADGVRIATRDARLLYVYGFNVTLRHADGVERYRTGLWEEAALPGPLGTGPYIRKEAFLVLRFEDEWLELTSRDQRIRIVSPYVALAGDVAFDAATGVLRSTAGARSWNGERAHLRGSFVFDGRPWDARDKLLGHQLGVQGLGAAEAESPEPHEAVRSSAAPSGTIALWIAASVAALLVWKASVLLYTRLARGEILDEPTRRRLYDAVRASPGIGLPALVGRSGRSRTDVRHHLRMLQRHGLIRVVRIRGSLHCAAADAGPHRALQASWLEADPRLRDVVAHVGGRTLRAHELVRHIQEVWRMSRSTSWSLVERAVEAQLLVKERRDGCVNLRVVAPMGGSTTPAPVAPPLPESPSPPA